MNAENSLCLPPGFHLQKDANGFLGLQAGSYGSFALKLPDSPPLKSQPLAKALGFSKRRRTALLKTALRGRAPLRTAAEAEAPTVFDVTAGWGKDACLIALLGFRVRAFEKTPAAALLLKEALARQPLPKISLQVISGDSLQELSRLQNVRPDIIYMDPFFGPKKSLSAKPVRILRALCRESRRREREERKLRAPLKRGGSAALAGAADAEILKEEANAGKTTCFNENSGHAEERRLLQKGKMRRSSSKKEAKSETEEERREREEMKRLFRFSLQCARQKVIVKRHRLQKPFSDGRLTASFKGRSICYDVFRPISRGRRVFKRSN